MCEQELLPTPIPCAAAVPQARSSPNLRPEKHAISGTTPSFNRPLSRKTPIIRDEPPPQTTLHPGNHPVSGTTPGQQAAGEEGLARSPPHTAAL